MGNEGSKSRESSPLVQAIKVNNVQSLSDQLAKSKPTKAQLNSLLHEAVQYPAPQCVNKLIELGAEPQSVVDDPFASKASGFVSGKQCNVLHRSALAGQGEVFILLLDKVAATEKLVDQRCSLTRENGEVEQGVSPLHCVILGNFVNNEQLRFQCANRLLSTNKVDQEARFGADSNTPLLLAQYNGRNQIVQFLIANRANFNATNRLGKGILHAWGWFHAGFVAEYAVKILNDLRDVYNVGEKEAEIFGMFMRMGVNIHQVDNEGNTGLHDAAYRWSYIFYDCGRKMSYEGHREIFELTVTYKTFIINKFDKETKNKKGEAPWFIIQRGHGFNQHHADRQKKASAKTK